MIAATIFVAHRVMHRPFLTMTAVPLWTLSRGQIGPSPDRRLVLQRHGQARFETRDGGTHDGFDKPVHVHWEEALVDRHQFQLMLMAALHISV